MELTVLGSCGTWPGPGRAASGYLVRHAGTSIWLDAGTGTLANLQRHVALADLDAIVISHEHADHMIDLVPTYYARRYGGLGDAPLPLFAPPGVLDKVRAVVGSAEELPRTFAIHEVTPGEAFDVGGVRFATRRMAHFDLPALGFRVEADGAVLAYTGDTGPCAEAVEIARDADLFLAEAVWQDGDAGGPFHLSAREAGDHAREAGVRRLALTHIWPSRDADRSVAQARSAFDGEVLVAVEDMTMEVHA